LLFGGVSNIYVLAKRLKPDDITYIFDFAEVDSIVVDNEYVSLLDDFKKTHPKVKFIIDTVSFCHVVPLKSSCLAYD
jgi:hypothetical protein